MIRLTLLLATLAFPAYAADGHDNIDRNGLPAWAAAEPWEAKPAEAYTLAGPDYRGTVLGSDAVARNTADTSVVVPATGLPAWARQNVEGGFHSRDRGLMGIDMSHPGRTGAGGQWVQITDLGDQRARGEHARRSRAVVTFSAVDEDGNRYTVAKDVIRGRYTRYANGNVITYALGGWYNDPRVTIKTGPGKKQGHGIDTGDKGWADGFSVKTGTVKDCPPEEDEGTLFRSREFRKTTVDQPPQSAKASSRNSGRSGKSGGGKGNGKRGK